MKAVRRRTTFCLTAAVVATISTIGVVPARAAVDTVTLQSLNSTVRINYDGPLGVDQWQVNGQNQLAQEWFWYRLGSTGPQSSLDTLQLVGSPVPVDSNGGGTNNFVSTTYQTLPTATNKFKVAVTYNLTGSQNGSGTSDLGESIKITDTGATSLTFHFFEYTNFDMGGTAGADSVQITGGTITNPAGNTATQVDGVTLATSQTVVGPHPNESQIGGSSPNPNLLSELTTVNGLTLNNALKSAVNTDAAWAFEWDVTINPNAFFLITVDKELRQVPEPTTGAALLGLGWIFLSRRPGRRGG